MAGLARGVDGVLRLRNRIYARVFDRKWITGHMPGAELRRQQRAYGRGVLRTAAIAAMILTTIAVLAGIALREARRANRNAAATQRNAAAQRAQRETEAEWEKLRRHLYVAQVGRAQQAWEAGNLGRAL